MANDEHLYDRRSLEFMRTEEVRNVWCHIHGCNEEVSYTDALHYVPASDLNPTKQPR